MAQWTGAAGKRVVITGASGGIGLAAARELATHGAQITIVAREQARGAAAARAVEAAGGGRQVDVLYTDLAAQASVRSLAAALLERYPRIDVLVNNAGAMYARRTLSPDGFELTWAVNHLAPFLLSTLLVERLVASAPARIVTTSSAAHEGARIPFDDLAAEHGYQRRGFGRYSETKLANILFTSELARRLEGSGVTANCFHPGLVASGFNRNNGALMAAAMTLVRPFSRSPEHGARTLVWLVDSPEVSDQSGGYFADERRVAPTAEAQDSASARRLWELSESQVATAQANSLQ
jgi:NAD(P)-dependent dehydrogenase (short-subunit alcohol dehydrogenase family)